MQRPKTLSYGAGVAYDEMELGQVEKLGRFFVEVEGLAGIGGQHLIGNVMEGKFYDVGCESTMPLRGVMSAGFPRYLEAAKALETLITNRDVTVVVTFEPKRAMNVETAPPGDAAAHVQELKSQISFFQLQLAESRLFHVQLTKLGLGALLVSLVSIGVWLATGVGAPLHPAVALVTVPAGVLLLAMAYFVQSMEARR